MILNNNILFENKLKPFLVLCIVIYFNFNFRENKKLKMKK